MRLTVLGSATPYPRPGNPCSGYLVQEGGTTVWVDAGPGTLAEVQRHVRLDEIDAIWISHLHADHTADLLATYYALRFADLELDAPIPLFAPAELTARLTAFLASDSAEQLPRVLDHRAHEDAANAILGDVRLSWLPVDHGGNAAYGLRIDGADVALAYSGDTAPCDAVVELAMGTAALLCEAGDAEEKEEKVHCTPEDAALLAARAEVPQLLLTHVHGSLMREVAEGRAATVFGGEIRAVVSDDILML